MKRCICLFALLIAACSAQHSQAGFEVLLDMDTTVAGIDSSVTVAPGATIDVGVVVRVTAPDSLGGYAFGVDVAGPATFDSGNHTAIGGFTPLASPSVGNGFRFSAGVLGGGTLAVPGDYNVGTLSFVVTGSGGLTPSIDAGFEGFSNASGSVPDGSVALTGGSFTAVPEPGSLAMLSLGLGTVLLRRRRS